MIPYRGEVYAGAHEAIIDADTWNAYQAERTRRAAGKTKQRRSAYLMSHLMRCTCGARMNGKGAVTGGRWYGGYLCGQSNSASEHPQKAYVSALALHPVIDEWMLGFDVERAAGDQSTAASASRRDRAVRRLAELEDEAANILRDRGRPNRDAPVAAYDRALAMIAEERIAAEDELRALDLSAKNRPHPEKVFELRKVWPFLEIAEKNRTLRKFLSSVTLSEDGESVTLTTTWPDEPVSLRLANPFGNRAR